MATSQELTAQIGWAGNHFWYEYTIPLEIKIKRLHVIENWRRGKYRKGSQEETDEKLRSTDY